MGFQSRGTANSLPEPRLISNQSGGIHSGDLSLWTSSSLSQFLQPWWFLVSIPSSPSPIRFLEGLPGANLSPKSAIQLQWQGKKDRGNHFPILERPRHAALWTVGPGSLHTASGATTPFPRLSSGATHTHITGDFWDKWRQSPTSLHRAGEPGSLNNF